MENQMYVMFGERCIPAEYVQLRVVNRRITGYLIGVAAPANPNWATGSVDQARLGYFTDSGSFRTILSG